MSQIPIINSALNINGILTAVAQPLMVLFLIALLHVILAPFLQKFSFFHHRMRHYLVEVECVFAIWASVFLLYLGQHFGLQGVHKYLANISFVEPLFIALMLMIAACTPLLLLVRTCLEAIAKSIFRLLNPASNININANINVDVKSKSALQFSQVHFSLIMIALPILGGFITEVAAMILAALMLKPYFKQLPKGARYVIITTLCANVSIGGAMTPFAAPPILMVAQTWGWDLGFMLSTFGWRAALAIVFNVVLLLIVYHKKIADVHLGIHEVDAKSKPSLAAYAVGMFYMCLMIAVIIHAHAPLHLGIIAGIFLLSYFVFKPHHQAIVLKEAVLIALFLIGLLILGYGQQVWLKPLLSQVSSQTVFFMALGLSAVLDNATITYLVSLVPNLSMDFKFNSVAGALSAGGVSILANAPNLLALAILKRYFKDGNIHHGYWLLASLPATLVAICAFMLI